MEKRKITPQERWQKKVGYMSKSYKLKKDLVGDFASTCERLGVSQASQLTALMKDFIEQNKEVNNEK